MFGLLPLYNYNVLFYKKKSSISNRYLFITNQNFSFFLFSFFFFNKKRILKIVFKGKFSKWFRRAGKIILKFGKTHLSYIKRPQALGYVKKNRSKFMIFSKYFTLLWSFFFYASKLRRFNIYNNRGIRLKSCLLLRKSGKVSAYR